MPSEQIAQIERCAFLSINQPEHAEWSVSVFHWWQPIRQYDVQSRLPCLIPDGHLLNQT
jgi:hypothetical protein